MRTFWALLVATALCIGAQAQTLLYSTGFENPPFVAGQSAVGVDGWAAGSGGGVSQAVSGAVACSGSQSLRWDNSGTLTSFYSIYRSLNWNPTSAANGRLIVRASVRVSAGAGPNRLYGVYLSTGASLSGTALGVTIAGDGKIRVGTSWSATFSSTTWLAQAPAGTYTDRCLRIEIDYDSETGRANIRVSGFADGAEYTTALNQSTRPTDIHLGTDFVLTTNRAGVGYFDDLEILEAPSAPFEGWDEIANGGGDAGDQIETAQRTSSNPIPRIRGTIGAANDVDIYALYIEDPQNFSASTIGGTTLDTALWLFDADGRGVLHNDDNPDATTGFQSRIDNRGGQITQAGVYYLAVGIYTRRAAGCRENLIWQTSPTRAIRAPDGPEATSRLGGWSGTSTTTGRYIITLTGVRGEPAGTDPADCPPLPPRAFTLTDGDTTLALRDIRGLPTRDANNNGDYRSVSGGPDHLFQNWWWFRTDTDPREFALSNLTAFDQPAPNTATLTYTEGNLSITLRYTLTDAGDNQAKLRINALVTNNGSSDVTVNLFNYSDFDMNGTFGSDNGQLEATGHMSVSEGDNTAHIFTANPPFAWQMGAYPSVRNLLTDADVDDLNNSGSPFGPGDWTGAFQWQLSLNAGGSRLVRMLINLNVAPALCEGDANGDGVVNNADLLLVLFAFGQTGARVEDVNGDGVVNNADLLVVLFNFGCSN